MGKEGIQVETLLEGPAGKGKKASFGSDFEQEDNLGLPPAKKAKPSDPKPSDPTPGTSQDPDPEPDPAPEGSITWPSDEEHWKLPHLPNNHSKRF